MTVTPNPDHPAPFSPTVLAALQDIVDAETDRLGREPTVLDPFAGVGRIHDLRRCRTYGIELEPEWAACRSATRVGDATNLVEPAESFDAVMTSPCYGNRMADHHDARDTHKKCEGKGCSGCKGTGISPRKTYRHSLGRMPTEGSASIMQWGERYRQLHESAIAEMVRVVKVDGVVVVNMSDHIMGLRVMPVVGWWCWALGDAGLFVDRVTPVPTPRMRQGQNHELRVPHEQIIVARRLT